MPPNITRSMQVPKPSWQNTNKMSGPSTPTVYKPDPIKATQGLLPSAPRAVAQVPKVVPRSRSTRGGMSSDSSDVIKKMMTSYG